MSIPLLELGYFYAFMSSSVTKIKNGIALHLSSTDSHVEISSTFPVLPKHWQNAVTRKNNISDKE